MAPTMKTAATIKTAAARGAAAVCSGTSRMSLEVHAEIHADRTRRVRQEPDPRAPVAFAVERQERALIEHVVHEQRGLPAIRAESPAQIRSEEHTSELQSL